MFTNDKDIFLFLLEQYNRLLFLPIPNFKIIFLRKNEEKVTFKSFILSLNTDLSSTCTSSFYTTY